ncbi:MAG TPA: ATP-binding cassette domain-containing protein [Miltoncostaeaceae bacterium]|nr:ATP-binding cassette domain-containing protein [Miltoncostaeaceae bacterium]
MIAVRGVVKTFGATRALDDLTFDAAPGRVTGFLGPNGAGKTTTLRVLLGLVHPDRGTATIGGTPYARLPSPARTVGAVLDAAAGAHPGRTARDHLRVLCDAAGFPAGRADETLAYLGLADAAHRRAGGFSLGMRQRLALAAALLGDPPVLVLDEPANGLDPAGIRWLRDLLRALAGEGRTVLVSSHVLSEVAQTVDDVVVIAHGRLVTARPLADLLATRRRAVRVRSPDAGLLAPALIAGGARVTRGDDGALTVEGVDAAAVGDLCHARDWTLHELSPAHEGLEDVFLRLVEEGP